MVGVQTRQAEMRLTEVIKIIGEDRVEEFHDFMRGQTCGRYEDGDIDYFEQDVENFLRPKQERFFD